uniref:DNA primase n=1 Tax=candidate division WWE3 bacterium TaxID=2053526 RepID=A0A832DUJ9_UNCKA
MPDQIEEVKRKLDIVEVASSYFPLHKSGKNYKALCPFHSEKTPSFMVSPTLQIFKCFGCGEGGDVISFYGKIEGVSFGEALKEMAKRAGVKLLSRKESPQEQQRERILEINRLAANYFHFLLSEHKIGSGALEFLKRRGLKKETIEDFELGYAPSAWDNLGRYLLKKGYSLTDLLQAGLVVRKEGGRGYFDFFRGRVMFPMRSSLGKVVGFAGRTLENNQSEDGSDQGPKYINTVETPVFKKGSYLFNLDLAKTEIKKQRRAILVEGEMDAIVLFQEGVRNVVATKGTALSAAQISALSKFAHQLVICFDRDAAGLEATKKGLMLALEAGLEVAAVLLPEGKDPDEAILAAGPDFKRSLDSAPPLFDFYLESALARFDRRTPAGKKAIASEILPVVKSLANEVEKSAYLSRLAQELLVEEEVIWKQLEKEKPLAGEEASARAAVSPRAPARQRELYLLALLLALPSQKLPSAVRRIGVEDLLDGRIKQILLILRNYLKGIKRFRLENFSAKLDKSFRDVLQDAALAPFFGEMVPEELEQEFERALASVKKARRVWDRKMLVAQVKEAEQQNQPTRVRRLQKEILKLTEKIDSLPH